MNTMFNFNRFLLLCKREFTEGRVQCLRWYGILSAVLFFLFFSKGDGMQAAFFVVVAVTSALFIQGISNRQKRVFYLTIPASALEKLLSRYIYISVLIFVTFLAAVLTAKAGQQLFSHFVFGTSFDWSCGLDDWRTGGDSHPVLGFFTLQAVYMLGSMVWLKNSFFKTSLFHIVFGSVIAAGIFILLALLHEPHYANMSFSLVHSDNRWVENLFYGVHIVMLAFFYVLCYFRFRELGIVHKLLPLSPVLRIVGVCYLLLLVTLFVMTALGLAYVNSEMIY